MTKALGSGPIDNQRRSGLWGLSNADDKVPVDAWFDPSTHRLLVDAVSFSSATVVGNKSNNAVVPGATNLGTLPAIANAASPTWIEGNQVGLSVDLSGNLRVSGTFTSSGTTDNSAFTAGTSTGTPAMAFYHSTIDTVTDGRAAALAIDSKRNLFTVLRDAAGNARGANVDANNNLGVVLAAETTKVIGTINIAAAQTIATVTTVTTVSAARIVGNGGAVLDGVNTAATAPANGILGLGIYNSTEPSPTTGQSVGIQLDSKGRQRMVIMDAAGNTRGLNVDANNNLGAVLQTQTDTVMIGGVNIKEINAVAPLMGAGNTGTGSMRVTIATDQAALAAWGKGATGAAVPAGAQYEGFNAMTALPTAATAGNLTGGSSDKYGRQIVLPVTVRDLVGTQTTTISASTAETTIVTQAASVFNDLILLVISNTSATAARLDFRDTTGGSILFSLYIPAGDTRGFSMGGVPIPQTTVNTNWTAQSSASVTDLRVYAVFAKNR